LDSGNNNGLVNYSPLALYSGINNRYDLLCS